MLDSAAQSIGVHGRGFSVSVDSATGKVSLSNGGAFKVVGPTLNLGEARYDDGDFLNREDPPWIGSKSPPILSDAHVIGGMLGDRTFRASVSANVTLAERPGEVLGKLKYVVGVHADGEMDWAYHLAWTSSDMQAWELGVKFAIPGDTIFKWFRKGQWTEYPAGHIGANLGTAASGDRAFDSTKRDTIWATVAPKSGDGVALIASNGPLHARCRFADGVTTVFASSLVSVDRDFSSGYLDDTRITFRQGRTYDGAFKLRLINGEASAQVQGAAMTR